MYWIQLCSMGCWTQSWNLSSSSELSLVCFSAWLLWSSFLACVFCSTESFISTCFFPWSSHLFLFFFFCSQNYNKKLWNWVLINIGPVSNCLFSACLYGFVHVCQLVCLCLQPNMPCTISTPVLQQKHFSPDIYSCTQFCLAFRVAAE